MPSSTDITVGYGVVIAISKNGCQDARDCLGDGDMIMARASGMSRVLTVNKDRVSITTDSI